MGLGFARFEVESQRPSRRPAISLRGKWAGGALLSIAISTAPRWSRTRPMAGKPFPPARSFRAGQADSRERWHGSPDRPCRFSWAEGDPPVTTLPSLALLLLLLLCCCYRCYRCYQSPPARPSFSSCSSPPSAIRRPPSAARSLPPPPSLPVLPHPAAFASSSQRCPCCLPPSSRLRQRSAASPATHAVLYLPITLGPASRSVRLPQRPQHLRLPDHRFLLVDLVFLSAPPVRGSSTPLSRACGNPGSHTCHRRTSKRMVLIRR